MSATLTDNLRHQPELKSLFKTMEGRDPKDEELALYRQIVPDYAHRAAAATAVREVEGPIVRKVIKAIFAAYPYEKHHQMATAKAIRDVRYVCSYGILSMLMGDVDWYRDKLLIWMKTIIQSFEYPNLDQGKETLFKSERAHVQSLKPGQKSIYECYYMLDREMEAALEPAHYREIEPFLKTAIQVLAHD